MQSLSSSAARRVRLAAALVSSRLMLLRGMGGSNAFRILALPVHPPTLRNVPQRFRSRRLARQGAGL
jgi:hypothetical protein